MAAREQEQQGPAIAHLVRDWPVRRLEGEAPPQPGRDAVALEQPLELRVDGQVLAVLMRTPGHDRELAVGLLAAEGVVRAPGDVAAIAESELAVALTLAPAARARTPASRRLLLTTSACGVCAQTALGEVLERFGRVPAVAAPALRRSVLYQLPERLAAAQRGFARSGGLHAAALFDRDGALLCAREDVGRHNALDKVLGARLLAGALPAAGQLVLVSGRASYELAAKAVALGAAVLAAVSAPSSLAIELAERAGLTLIGFLRGESMNVYTHPERIEGALA
ncbi:MAG: sulfurtransferase FdhD [Planctomycetota bacterium]|nr:MAG: sulfurtransferase FdhD [Planctomycetota bacterium]